MYSVFCKWCYSHWVCWVLLYVLRLLLVFCGLYCEAAMSEGLKSFIPVPDLWFDIIARMIPGVVCFLILRWYFSGLDFKWVSDNLIVTGLGGYFVGLYFSPLSSSTAAIFHKLAPLAHENLFHSKKRQERIDVRTVSYQLGLESNTSSVLSKMHGEVVFFVQCGWMAAFLTVLPFFSGSLVTLKFSFPFGCMLLFLMTSLLLAFSVSIRRYSKALNEYVAWKSSKC